MLEILLIIYFARKIGKIAEKKGHKKRPNVIFFVVMWFAGELIGGLLGSILTRGNFYATYILALIGAAVGAWVAFNIVNKLDDRSDPDTIIIDGD